MENSYKDSMIAKRVFQFALSVIRLTKGFSNTYENTVIIKQIIRSVTSIGANIEEALGANSRKEFTHCMNIAKKEARETLYWLKLLFEVNGRNNQQVLSLIDENTQIINILTKIVKTSSNKVV